jgi:hypothetical protein
MDLIAYHTYFRKRIGIGEHEKPLHQNNGKEKATHFPNAVAVARLPYNQRVLGAQRNFPLGIRY